MLRGCFVPLFLFLSRYLKNVMLCIAFLPRLFNLCVHEDCLLVLEGEQLR